MSQYLCVDPRHYRFGRFRPVDVTAQVRLERALMPESPAYLAVTEQVVSAVRDLPQTSTDERRAAVEHILTKTPQPRDLPVVLVSERSVGRPSGVYDMAELRRSEPGVQRLSSANDLSGSEGTTDDLVLLESEEPAPGAPPAGEGGTLLTRPAVRRARVIPQGVFRLRELATRLAEADRDEDSLVRAIQGSPTYTGGDVDEAQAAPWRVVVECPVPEGEPPTRHQTVFTSPTEPESPVVYGTPAGGMDSMLEESASRDLAPSSAVSQADRRLRWLVLAEVLVAGALLALGWASGFLGLAARETPGWLAFALTLGLGAAVFGTIPLFATGDTDDNADDTFALRRFYRSRLEMFRWAAMISAGLFVLALVVALVPPVLAAGTSIPAATVSFDATSQPVTTTVRVNAHDVATDTTAQVETRQFFAGDSTGTLIGQVATNGDASGRVHILATMALDPSARYVSVRVGIEGQPRASSCSPTRPVGPGCTVVSVPPLGAGVLSTSSTVIVPAVITSPQPAITPTPSP